MQRIGWNRRDFLRVAAGMGVSSKWYGLASFAPEGQENIPNLVRELIPQFLFYTGGEPWNSGTLRGHSQSGDWQPKPP